MSLLSNPAAKDGSDKQFPFSFAEIFRQWRSRFNPRPD